MSKIDQYKLLASEQFPISGTEEISENLQLTPSSLPQAGVVTGTVTSGGEPVENAIVKVFDVNDNPVAHQLTNPQGSYTITEIVQGSYKITATKFGYLTPDVIPFTIVQYRPTTVDIAMTVNPDATLNTIFGIIRQSVVLTPIEMARVIVYQIVDDERVQIMCTCTNSGGQYLAPNLDAGDYVITAIKSGYDEAESAVITVTTEDVESLDLNMIPSATGNTGTVSGIISDADTLLPIADAVVALYSVVDTTETVVQVTRSNAGGRYLFGNVEAGEYLVKSFSQTDAPES